MRHGFTHFRLELALFAGTTTEPPAGIWAAPAEFKDYAFPTLTRKLAKYALSALSEPTCAGEGSDAVFPLDGNTQSVSPAKAGVQGHRALQPRFRHSRE